MLLLSMARTPEQLRAVAEHLGSPLMYLAGRGGLAGLGMTLSELGSLGYRIVADPGTALLAAFSAWKQVYADLADDFGASARPSEDWGALEHEMLDVIGLERLLEVERRTVDNGDLTFDVDTTGDRRALLAVTGFAVRTTEPVAFSVNAETRQ